ncbi:uncharacterized protein LOC116119714 [Pistacia vera]|uniref:uncharacterized protein LOC116119714 n=1 Tax=Pistacia vera TaxID=55513 RepID=UPI0012639525|nr:uncharacterized protein LOC116119714 [Pistacia vera]
MENFLDDGSVHTCDQCEHKFHTGCLRRRGEVKVKNYAHDNWFYSDRCEHVSTCIHKLTGMPISLGVDDLTWRLLKNGKDLVEYPILNKKSEMRHKNFQGFYTVVLEGKGEIVFVATIRAFEEVVEIPLVATRLKYCG